MNIYFVHFTALTALNSGKFLFILSSGLHDDKYETEKKGGGGGGRGRGK
jgi:hypothetical protein